MCTICGFEKAYDFAYRQSLFYILKEFNYTNKQIKIIESTMQNTEVKVKVASNISGPATVNTDLDKKMRCH